MPGLGRSVILEVSVRATESGAGEISQIRTNLARSAPLASERVLDALLPKDSPVPAAVCLGGNVLLPSKPHWGKLKTGVARQQRPCDSTTGTETWGGGVRGNTAQLRCHQVTKAAVWRSPVGFAA